MQTLKTLIEVLEKNRKIHISILDLGGILSLPDMKIDFKNVIHSKEFCNIAKSTEIGYSTCLKCKKLANEKAIKSMQPYYGQCVYGLYEYAVPVIIEKNVMAIVYVGNAILNEEKVKEKIKITCKLTGVSVKSLYRQLEECEKINDIKELYQIADIVSDYIKTLYLNQPKTKVEMHWLVQAIKKYADKRFCYNLTLKELAITYQKNEQYLGRLFKKHMGVDFSTYCMQLRLIKAENLLQNSKNKIIEIALDSGFNNVSYFNRAFRKKHGISPKEYRAKNTK